MSQEQHIERLVAERDRLAAAYQELEGLAGRVIGLLLDGDDKRTFTADEWGASQQFLIGITPGEGGSWVVSRSMKSSGQPPRVAEI